MKTISFWGATGAAFAVMLANTNAERIAVLKNIMMIVRWTKRKRQGFGEVEG